MLFNSLVLWILLVKSLLHESGIRSQAVVGFVPSSWISLISIQIQWLDRISLHDFRLDHPLGGRISPKQIILNNSGASVWYNRFWRLYWHNPWPLVLARSPKLGCTGDFTLARHRWYLVIILGLLVTFLRSTVIVFEFSFLLFLTTFDQT